MRAAIETFVQDLRYAARVLARNGGFTAAMALTLALGIGANTAIFSLLHQLVLSPLPVKDPERLVLLHGPGPRDGMSTSNKSTPTPLSYPMFTDFRDRSPVFDGVLAYFPTAAHLAAGGETERLHADVVSGTYFEVLGLRPAAGRLLAPADDRTPGAHPVAVLSHGLWRRRFAEDPAVVGRAVAVNGHPFTVVGVAPASFRGLEVGRDPGVFVPLTMKAQMTPTWDRLLDRQAYWLTVLARLKPEVTLAEATAASNVVYRQVLESEAHTVGPDERPEFLAKRLQLLPGGRGASGVREGVAPVVSVLMGLVALVLLIACANVANLLLARAVRRQKEIAVRLSIGAGRGRLVRQLLTESLLLACLGGALGLAVGSWTGSLLLRALPADAAAVLDPDPSAPVLAFTLGLCLLTALLCGLVPALQATRPHLVPSLKETAAASAGGAQAGRLRRGLVVTQMALSVLLLVGSGLFARTLRNLEALDLGFDPERLVTFSVNPALNGYEDGRKRALFVALQEELARLPAVRAVSMSQDPLLAGSVTSGTVRVDGYTPRQGEDVSPHFNSVGTSFFTTLGIPLLAGRIFDERDGLGAPKVAVVNESFARYFFGSESPIGRRFANDFGDAAGPPDVEIVGLVRDARSSNVREGYRIVYRPLAQQEAPGRATYYVRARGEEAELPQVVRAAVARVDPSLPVYQLKTMRAQAAESLIAERAVAFLAAVFAMLATALAALGLYAIVSQGVVQRTRELGVRVALGAAPRQVLRLVMGEAGRLAAVGAALGVLGGLLLSRLVRAQLFGLAPHDPLTFAAAAGLLGGIAALAAYVPARRAARIDPVTALRYE